jgi:ATP-binding cassette, subfamily B, bacterial
MAVFTEVLNAVYHNLTALGTGLVLLFAGQGLRSGAFTVGDFAFFVAVLDYVGGLAGSVGIFVGRYQAASVALARLQALVPDTPPAMLAAPAPVSLRRPPPLVPSRLPATHPRLATLAVTELTYRYLASGRGITGVSLRLARGSFTVITGQIGAGKTTLLLTLLGLLPYDQGEIRWNEVVVADPAAFFVPPRSAFTPQVPRLFSEALGDNLLLGLDATTVDLPAALRAAVLAQAVAALAQGLATVIGPRGETLRRAGAAGGGRAHVCAPAGTAGLRRPL